MDRSNIPTFIPLKSTASIQILKPQRFGIRLQILQNKVNNDGDLTEAGIEEGYIV
ncbi:MAG: hypothetical protein SWO11_17440 [Thermodesulfobacteriota bacterium]|nr:hypothetical protein [Thermodesulfobacteriota bacterium]